MYSSSDYHLFKSLNQIEQSLAQFGMFEKTEEQKSNFFNLPYNFNSTQIQNADKLHASLQKAGIEGYFHTVLKCIIIISKKSSKELQAIIDDGTEYSNWKPEVQGHRDYEGNALVLIK